MLLLIIKKYTIPWGVLISKLNSQKGIKNPEFLFQGHLGNLYINIGGSIKLVFLGTIDNLAGDDKSVEGRRRNFIELFTKSYYRYNYNFKFTPLISINKMPI
jgi:hypothetical protein